MGRATTGVTGMGQGHSEGEGNRSPVTDLLHPLSFPLKSKLKYYPL